MVSPAPGQFARDLAGQVKLVKANADTAPRSRSGSAPRPSRPCWYRATDEVTARQTGATPLAAVRTWGNYALAQAAR
jgi:thioredoxin 2